MQTLEPHTATPPNLHQPVEQIEFTCARVVARNLALFANSGVHDAEELTQECLVYVVANAHRYDRLKSAPSTFTWNLAYRRLLQLASLKSNQHYEQMPHDNECGDICSDEIVDRAGRALESARQMVQMAPGERQLFPLASLVACLVLAAGMRQSMRAFRMMLAGSPDLVRALELRRVPSLRHLYRAERAARKFLRRG